MRRLLAAGLLFAAPAAAQDARDAEIFGTPASAPAAGAPPATGAADAPPATPPADARDAEIFGEPGAPPPASAPAQPPPAPDSPPTMVPANAGDERDSLMMQGGDPSRAAQAVDDDPLDVGGRLYLRFDTYFTRDTEPLDHKLSSPNLLDVYLDSRPHDQLRAFFQGRLSHDPTLTATGQRTAFELDQLWIKLNAAQRVFVTLGKQPVKWGAAHIWNPTDFVNRSRRNPLDPFDFRTGVTLAKVHIPVESWGSNFYLLGLFDGADTLDQVGGAARAEFAFSSAEVSLSGIYPGDGDPRFGGDLSAGVGDFDVIVEAASAVVDGELAPEATGGLEYTIPYGNRDSLHIGAEYYYNDRGADDPDDYPARFAAGVDSFYMVRHSAGLYVFVPGPGTWDDTSFVLTALSSLTDRTAVARLNVSTLVLTYLSVEPYVAGHFGEVGGLHVYEFRNKLLNIDVKAPIAEAGLWFRMTL